MADGLLPLVKAKLRIDAADTADDARINQMVWDAEAELRSVIGIPDGGAFDFSQPGEERALLLNLCFYEWNDAHDDFAANYAAQISAVRNKRMVMQFAEGKQESADV